MPNDQVKLCERCGRAWAVRRSRFCKDCCKEVLAELDSVGYLTKKVPKPTCRSGGKCESSHDPNPSQENALRAWEDG